MKDKVRNIQEILTSLPNKRYFSIGETSAACDIKPYVLRYWEREFPQLNPLKRNQRRYYRSEDVEFIIVIRDLLHIKRFTIQGARSYLSNQCKNGNTGKNTAISQSTLFSAVTQVVRRIDGVIERLEKNSA